jgi:copper transport protein
VLARAPARVVLRFSEPVETAFGAVRVYDSDATRVDSGHTSRPASNEVAVDVGSRLPDGTYTVAWRVVSADTHPVHGAFVFSVGKAQPGAAGIAAKVLAGEETPKSIDLAFWLVRFAALALVLLVAGGGVALAAVLAGADVAVRRRLALGLAGAALALALVSLAGIVLQGADAGGYGVVRAARWDVVSAVLDTRFGQAWLARASLAGLVAIAWLAVSRRPSALPGAVAAVLSLGLVPTLSVAGHAAVSGGLELAADMVHATAAAVWVGGLAAVGVALLATGREKRGRLAVRAVPRFSTLALGSVAVLLAAGLVNGYLQVRAWEGLWETAYGRLLLAKAFVLAVLVGVGAYHRLRAVPQIRRGEPGQAATRPFARTVGAELAVMVAAVGLTAALVAEPPARAQVARTGPFATTTHVGPFELNLVVDPARAGPNQIHLYLLDRSGRPAPVAEARIAAALPSAGIGPIKVAANEAGPGHYIAPGAVLAIPGDWRVTVTVRRGEFDEWQRTTTTPIR